MCRFDVTSPLLRMRTSWHCGCRPPTPRSGCTAQAQRETYAREAEVRAKKARLAGLKPPCVGRNWDVAGIDQAKWDAEDLYIDPYGADEKPPFPRPAALPPQELEPGRSIALPVQVIAAG